MPKALTASASSLERVPARALQGSRRAGLEALLNLAATAEGSSFLLSGHSINLAHLHLSLMDRCDWPPAAERSSLLFRVASRFVLNFSVSIVSNSAMC